ncbi:MAG: permease [Methanomicrobiaceae archaeon]|nr:permease [Methanomicrobiaceae archaeon]
MKKEKKNSRSNFYFFVIVIAVYAITALLDLPTAIRALRIFADILLRIAPVLVLVFFLLFLTDLLISPKKMVKYLGRESGAVGWCVAIVGGIISSGPIYVWYPFLADLREKGMRPALAATFLYNRAVKVPLLPLMVYYFGIAFTAVLTVYMILFSLVNGYCTEWLMENPPGR